MKFIQHTTVTTQPVNHPGTTVYKKVLVSHGIIPSISNISFATIHPKDHVSSHTHDSLYEIFLVKTGTLTCTVCDKTVTAVAGDCLIIEPQEPHELRNNSTQPVELFYVGCPV